MCLKQVVICHNIFAASNILVHQTCECQSPLQCMCAGGVTYLLGDMDLFSLEEDSANSTYTCDEWEKMAGHDPAGTIGMKPPEVNKIITIKFCIEFFIKILLYVHM